MRITWSLLSQSFRFSRSFSRSSRAWTSYSFYSSSLSLRDLSCSESYSLSMRFSSSYLLSWRSFPRFYWSTCLSKSCFACSSWSLKVCLSCSMDFLCLAFFSSSYSTLNLLSASYSFSTRTYYLCFSNLSIWYFMSLSWFSS